MKGVTTMKKTLKLMGLCALAVLVLAGCKKNEQNGNMTFKATISQLNNNAKTEIGSGNWLVWNTGDQIKVYTADKTETNAANFTLATGIGQTQATFSGDLAESNAYYAFYPTTGVEVTGEGKFTLPVSGTQTFVDANFTTNTFPMCATTTDGDFEFHSPYGILGRLSICCVISLVRRPNIIQANSEPMMALPIPIQADDKPYFQPN